MRFDRIDPRLIVAGVVLSACGVMTAATPAVMVIGSAPSAVAKGDMVRMGAAGNEIQLTNVTRSGTDAATGMASGRANQKLVTVTKVYGANSEQLEEAAAEGKMLPEVTITFTGSNAGRGASASGMGAGKRPAQKLVLKNAQITQIVQSRNIQQISITYQAIEVTYAGGGVSATDDWETP